MLEKLKKYTGHIRFYDVENIPFHKECYLLGDAGLDTIEKQWLKALDAEYDTKTWEHPNALMDYIGCHISSSNETNFDLNLLMDRNSRFHTVTKSLPKKFFKTAFIAYTSETRASIVVDQKWFDQLRKNLYSAYVHIDFIGVKALLSEYGEFPVEKLFKIKSTVDKFSKMNPNLQFLSCADNIIIKSGWSFGSAKHPYAPEKLIIMVNLIMNEIKKETGLSAYAIFTQGVNYVNEKDFSLSPTPTNHLFISSISAPFIESFAIDDHVRQQMRDKKMKGQAFYLENSFYISTKRKYSSLQEPEWFKKIQFENKKTKAILSYAPVSYENICELIEFK